MTDIASALVYLFPSARPTLDYRVADDGTGQVIEYWDTATLGTQPDAAALAAAEAAGQNLIASIDQTRTLGVKRVLTSDITLYVLNGVNGGNDTEAQTGLTNQANDAFATFTYAAFRAAQDYDFNGHAVTILGDGTTPWDEEINLFNPWFGAGTLTVDLNGSEIDPSVGIYALAVQYPFITGSYVKVKNGKLTAASVVNGCYAIGNFTLYLEVDFGAAGGSHVYVDHATVEMQQPYNTDAGASDSHIDSLNFAIVNIREQNTFTAAMSFAGGFVQAGNFAQINYIGANPGFVGAANVTATANGVARKMGIVDTGPLLGTVNLPGDSVFQTYNGGLGL